MCGRTEWERAGFGILECMNRAGRLFPLFVGAAVWLGPLVGGSIEAQNGAPTPARLRPLAYTRFTLPNGLVAILNEDHTTPIVSVQVWYHVGSKDDDPARPGVIHLCEHLTSQGSPHLSQPQPNLYRSIGGTSGGQTTEDVTKFVATVPSNQLETVLWAESDRMAAPLALPDSQRIAAVIRLVEQERRQNVDNVPFGAARELIPGALFPTGHPYHLSALSQNSASSSAQASDLRAKCDPYYVPNNAVIAISGDFSTSTARSLIEKYFAGIPRGSQVVRANLKDEPLRAERRLVLEDARANQPRLHIAWRGASYGSPDRMAALALASALSLPRFGRLSKLLVNDRRLASIVTADNHDFEKSGVFEIVVVPNPGASMTLIEQLVDSTLASLNGTPVTTEELSRFNMLNQVSAATSLQLHVWRADTLAHDEVFVGDPSSYATQANAALSLTPADVQAAARRYLTPARVVMSLVPSGKLELISKPNAPYTNVTPPAASAPGAARP
jgi:zinc protease